MIHQHDHEAELPTPRQLLRTVGPIVLLALAAVTVVQGEIRWTTLVATAAGCVVGLSSVVWLRAAAADPPRPPTRSGQPRLPATPVRVSAAVPVVAVVLVAVGAFTGSHRFEGPHGTLDWIAAALVVTVQWSIFSIVLSALARVGTWVVLALTGRWPTRKPVAP